MSTHLEDRLTAALTARADLVQPEDLGSLAPPAATYSLRRSTALLAAASVVIAGTIAAVLLTSRNDDRPEPAKPLPDGYAEIGRATGDVDGDGRDDLVRLARRESSASLVVDLATAERLTKTLPAGGLPELVGLADVGTPARVIVTRHPGERKDFTLAVHAFDEGRLVQVRESKDSDERLRQRGSDVRIGYSIDPELTVWRFAGAGPEVEEVRVVNWTLKSGELVGRFGEFRCLHQGDPVPRACADITSVPEGMVEGPSIAVDLDADGVEDDIQLSGPKRLGSAPTVIIATLSSGDRTGTNMQHYGTFGGIRSVRLQSEHGPVTAVVVQSALSGGSPRTVYRLVDGRLTELLLATDVPVAPGRMDVSGYRMWSHVVDGTLLSWRQVTRGGREVVQEVVTYRYRTEGYRLIPVKVGRQCYDNSEVTNVPYPC
jgi:hypothetical protein